MSDVDILIRKYALANAFSHEGIAQAGAIIGKLINEDPKYKLMMGELAPKISQIVQEINKIPIAEQEKELRKTYPEFFEKKPEEKRELPDLPNAKIGKVILRLAPFPSGALHIGNAKTYMINALYAEKYKGKLYFVYDDTIGSEKKQLMPAAYKLIADGFKWLGVKWNGKPFYKSDRFKIYYEYGEDLLKKNLAYACDCPIDVLRSNREKGIECKCRQQTPEQNLKKWKDMLAKKYKEGEICIRLKTDMRHKNPAFRDRVLFKISERKHPRVGTKYKVWPTLEMSWSVDDHLLHITHVVRGKDLMIETDMEKFIFDLYGWKHPVFIHTGLVRLEGLGAKISKSKAQEDVKSGKFSGWDDPRTWSLQSLKRRGILPEAIREFIRLIGVNQSDIVVPVENLYAINRQMLDTKANRYSFVCAPRKIKIVGAPKLKSKKIKLHPHKKAMKNVPVSEEMFVSGDDFIKYIGQEIRLKDLYNVKLGEVSEFAGQEKSDVQKIQWVADKNVPADVLMPDGTLKSGLAEINVKKLKVGTILQFERFGFCKMDKKGKKYLFCFAHG